MSRRIRLLVLPLFAFVLLSCDASPEATQDPLALATEPTEELETMVQETPSDFTWDFFEDNIVVRLRSEREWEGSLVLEGFQIANGDVVNRVTTAPFQASAEELKGGLLSENIFTEEMGPVVWARLPSQKDVTIEFNVIDDEWGGKKIQSKQSIVLWTPESAWAPSQLEEAVIAETDLAQDETLYVMYARLEDMSSDIEQTTRPFGVVLTEESES